MLKVLPFLVMFLWRFSRQKSRKNSYLVYSDGESIRSGQTESRPKLCASCPWSCKCGIGKKRCCTLPRELGLSLAS